MLLTLFNFFFVHDDKMRYIDGGSMYVLTLHTNDITLTFSLIHYEDNFEYDSNAFPWVPQGGPIHIELDSLNLKDKV